MEDFAPILNWRLLYGSHDFPGPDGGTCINEAAIVVAGFAYRRVGHARELPPCFCPVIGEFSVWLNDNIPDAGLRMTLLLPFVTRLSGTKGDLAIETKRLDALREALLEMGARKLRGRRFTPRHQEHLLLGEFLGRMMARKYTIGSASTPRELIRIAEYLRSGFAASELASFYGRMAGALDAMLKIGPQSAPIESHLASERLSAVREIAGSRQAVARMSH